MKTRVFKWAAAFGASAVLHAGAVGLFLSPTKDEVQIQGGQPTELAIIGNAFEDQVSAGVATEEIAPSEADAVEPVETAQQTAAVEPEPVRSEAVQPERVQPQPPVEPTPTPQTEAIEPEPVASATPVPVPPAETPQEIDTPPESAEAAVPVEPEPTPAEDQEDVAAVEPETLEPLPEDELALVDVPIPTPRPAYTPPPQPQRTERQPEPRQQAARQPQRQGSGGQNQADTRRGSDEGGQSGSGASTSSQGVQANAAGNAAVSNYPGQIVTRLRRSLRYPREAQRQGLRGEVHVRFTVAGSGQVTALSVARSSGSPVLDEAALATVQRAAPFPAIPAAAGRNSWPFTVPLVFSR